FRPAEQVPRVGVEGHHGGVYRQSFAEVLPVPAELDVAITADLAEPPATCEVAIDPADPLHFSARPLHTDLVEPIVWIPTRGNEVRQRGR
ncbi:MAG TPA: hypothetical protein VKX16_07885, partial [Chloroflexota bacterium]|nr:hypothetical protein [Chloroflexota bacterium]